MSIVFPFKSLTLTVSVLDVIFVIASIKTSVMTAMPKKTYINSRASAIPRAVSERLEFPPAKSQLSHYFSAPVNSSPSINAPDWPFIVDERFEPSGKYYPFCKIEVATTCPLCAYTTWLVS